jgi:hypothetical protein
MATMQEKIDAEHRTREFLRSNGLPEPDGVEYGFTCVRFFFEEPKVCMVIDLDEMPEEDPTELSRSEVRPRPAAG